MNLLLMNPKILNYFNFRINQFFRLFNHESDFGAIYSIGFLCIIFLNLNAYPFVFVLTILLIHLRRKDIDFVKKVFPDYWFVPVLTEYTLLFLLFIVSNIHYKISIHSLYIYFIVISTVFIPVYSNAEYSLIKWNFIPNITFEWKSFLREKTLIAFIYFIGLLFSAYHPFTLILMGIFYLDFISNIYKTNENKELLESFFKKHDFSEKLKFNIIVFNLTLLPTIIIYLIMNYSEFVYLLYYILAMNLYLLLIISRKYSIYSHRIKENGYNSGIFMKYLISSFFVIPFFFFFKENYNNAIKRINLF